MGGGKRRFFSIPFPSSPARFLFPSLRPSLRYKEASAEERVTKLTTSSKLSYSWPVINMMGMMTPPIVDQMTGAATKLTSKKDKGYFYHPPFFVFTRCLCQKPSLARTSLVRVLTRTTREYNPVRHRKPYLVYTKTVDSVFRALWLATQSVNILHYSLIHLQFLWASDAKLA